MKDVSKNLQLDSEERISRDSGSAWLLHWYGSDSRIITAEFAMEYLFQDVLLMYV